MVALNPRPLPVVILILADPPRRPPVRSRFEHLDMAGMPAGTIEELAEAVADLQGRFDLPRDTAELLTWEQWDHDTE